MNSTPKKRLGDRLLDAGLISSEQLDLALLEQRRSGKLIGAVLQELGFVTEKEVGSFLAQAAETDTIDLASQEISPDTLALVPFELAKELSLIPVAASGHELTIAMADPFDIEAIDRIERLTRLQTKVLAASGLDIQDRLLRCHQREESVEDLIQQLMKISEATEISETTAPIVRLVDAILSQAASRSASDVHIEPDEKTLRIRFRVDGVLQPYLIIPKDLQDNVVARIKVISGLDVSETRLPQDGRISFKLGNRPFNLRISTLPTSFGESVVARLLDSSGLDARIDSLGMTDAGCDTLKRAVSAPYGMILVTGPTGSGKTTTLYTALKSVNRFERSVFTLEDPIEYRLEYTRQTQVNEKIGLTFDSGLRTLLRQDPDVIFVGETRDKETAQLLVRAALTGHLVLSSMHTSDTVSAIPRMLDLGAEPSMVASTLRLVIAQRLARKLCPACRAATEDLSPYRQMLGSRLPSDVAKLWQPAGCPECFNKGYRGRLAIFEMLEIDDEIRSLLPRGEVSGIYQAMERRGIPTMFDDGARRAIAGDTSIEEVYRVANQN